LQRPHRLRQRPHVVRRCVVPNRAGSGRADQPLPC
jgi:hypothetical protein